MGKVYGKNTSGDTQLIIDGDAIDQRLSELEANWDSIEYETTSVTWNNSFVFFQKRGGIVVCSGQVETTISAWETKKICNIPEGYEPKASRTISSFVNFTGVGRIDAYGSDGDYPNQLYAMAINAVTSNSIIFCISWATN